MATRSLGILAAVAVAATSLAPCVAAADDPPRVTIYAPRYESPGGLVPVIVTAWNPPSRSSVRLEVKGTDGATAACVGNTWHNPIRRSTSRSCYVELPGMEGAYTLVGRATFSRPGERDTVIEVPAARQIMANGFPTLEPMTIAHAQAIEHCWNDTNSVQLTFDDGANEERFTRIIRTLRENGVRGRFFFTGNWAREHPDRMRRIRRQGHLIGNHTKAHKPLSKLSDDEVMKQIDGGGLATTTPMLLRPPYGAGAFTTRLEGLAARRSFSLCRWTVNTVDWAGTSVARIVERIRYGDYATAPLRSGGVILMHGGGEFTSLGLQEIIDTIRALGFSLEKLR